MILTELPDLPPRPPTPRVAAFRRDFYRRWGRENCVVSGMSRHAEYGLFRQTLSIKCVAQGSEMYFVDRRRVAVSDDTFLVLNEGRTYASSLSSATDTYSFSIFFRPGLGEEVAAGLQSSLGAALSNGSLPMKATIEFDESLQHHDSKVTPVLRFIQRQVAAGVRDENWLEEQCQFLLERLITAHRHRVCCSPRNWMALDGRDAGAHSPASGPRFHACAPCRPHHARGLATAARLSRFHFLRVFQAAHGARRLRFFVAAHAARTGDTAINQVWSGRSRRAGRNVAPGAMAKLARARSAGARVVRRLDQPPCRASCRSATS